MIFNELAHQRSHKLLVYVYGRKEKCSFSRHFMIRLDLISNKWLSFSVSLSTCSLCFILFYATLKIMIICFTITMSMSPRDSSISLFPWIYFQILIWNTNAAFWDQNLLYVLSLLNGVDDLYHLWLLSWMCPDLCLWLGSWLCPNLWLGLRSLIWTVPLNVPWYMPLTPLLTVPWTVPTALLTVPWPVSWLRSWLSLWLRSWLCHGLCLWLRSWLCHGLCPDPNGHKTQL